MLADPKASALVDNFASQWLQLRQLASAQPQGREFDDNLREAFAEEARLMFGSILREDRSILDLLDADYTFVNERAGAPLRNRRRRGRSVPPCHLVEGQPATGLAGQRRGADRHVGRQSNIARDSRRVGAGERARRSTVAATARRRE